MRALLMTCALLAIALGCAVGTATAAPPPIAGGCNFATNPCWNGSLACFWVSEQVPFCLPIGLA